MSDNIVDKSLNDSTEALLKIEHLDFEGIDSETDNNELFGDRLANFAFYTKGNIELYNQKIANHKINKYLFNITGILVFLFTGIFLHTLLSIFLSSNPVSPSTSELLISNISLLILIFAMGGYVFLLKNQKKLLIFNVFNKVVDLIKFFEPTNRFIFIQYLLNNKDNFLKSDDKAFFSQKIKELKALDKNNDVIGFTLLVLFLYNCDVVTFYQNVLAKNKISYIDNKEIYSLMKYFEEKIQKQAQSINNKE